VYYGNKPNTNFLQFYGFVIENNDNDEIYLNLSINAKDTLKDAKEKLLDEHTNPKKTKLTETTENDKFSKTISYLRYIAFKGTEASLKEVIIREFLIR